MFKIVILVVVGINTIIVSSTRTTITIIFVITTGTIDTQSHKLKLALAYVFMSEGSTRRCQVLPYMGSYGLLSGIP